MGRHLRAAAEPLRSPTLYAVTVSTRAREDSFLARIVSTVSSSLELDEVLSAVVRLLTDASAVHACFVYLVEDDGDASSSSGRRRSRMRISPGRSSCREARASHGGPPSIASRPSSAENLLDDPRVKYVPELEEERFQSLLSVPIRGRAAT